MDTIYNEDKASHYMVIISLDHFLSRGYAEIIMLLDNGIDKEKREFVFLLNRGMEAIYEAQVLCRITFLHCVLPGNRCVYSIN